MPHRRYNPLNGDWVLVSPQRTNRPWQGQEESIPQEERPIYDPECYLCPGNQRAGGRQNPDYQNTFVFTNDFAALVPETPDISDLNQEFFKSHSVSGTSRVICFSPRHDLSLAEMEIDDIKKVIEVWIEQTRELSEQYRWVQVFENKGAIMGCSNPHPHGQVWAGDQLPTEPAKEDRQQMSYYKKNGSVLLLDYAKAEISHNQRIILADEHWLIIVPFWAVWPFETLLLPRRHILRLPELNEAEVYSLSRILKSLLGKYDNLFRISFPYSMGWHGAPYGNDNYQYWQLHAHFYPPLLRSASIKKFMVGYEMLAEPQRDLTAEQAAEHLRELSDIHYKSVKK